MKPKLMFYCQHVLGMGHLVRSRELVKGLGCFDVCFVNGGEPVDGFAFPAGTEIVQLPPIRSDAAFRDIDATETIRTERCQTLKNLFQRLRPDVLVIEMFPFGRRKFAFELVPLLDEVRQSGRRTTVVSSVRDILVSKRDQARHEEQACRLLNEYFDLVLVHADPRFQQLGETFLRAADIRCPVAYTGFVSEPLPEVSAALAGNRGAASARLPRIIASAGGGRVGFELLDAVIRASALLGRTTAHELTVYTGPYLPPDEFAALSAQASAAGVSWIRLERYAADFVSQLASASLLISQAGYNTCMNILATGVPALVHPFSGNQNEEQTIRAGKLAALGCLEVLSGADLDPAVLARRIAGALQSPPDPSRAALDLEGARHSAQLLERAAQGALAHV